MLRGPLGLALGFAASGPHRSGKSGRGSDRLDPKIPDRRGSLIPPMEVEPVIKIDLINFLIVWAFMVIARFIGNTVAALTHDSPIGQALSIIAI